MAYQLYTHTHTHPEGNKKQIHTLWGKKRKDN